MQKPREIAARVLREHAAGGTWLETSLEQALARSGMSAVDRALVQELTFGLVRWQATLDWLIAQRTGGRTQKPGLQILLRLGLYQIFWLDRIPDHAAVNETVEMAKRSVFSGQAGFVNAVLRGCLRDRESIERQLKELRAREPHLGYSHPQWLCDRWEKRWGQEKVCALLEWNNAPAPVYARVNALKTTAEQLAAQFESEGVRSRLRAFDWTGEARVFELESHPPLTALPSFQQGLFYVQDPSTLLAVRELDPQAGELILDLCAAPGGKTTFVAQLMQNRGLILAQDSDLGRCELIRQNCARLGITCVEVSPTVKASEQLPPRPFDRILVDAPCSNTGVVRRRIDLRWRIRTSEVERLRALQLDLLRRAAAQLKPGGTLVYSTCSLEPEENGEVVKAFLADSKQLVLEGERDLLPFRDKVDGAYVARMKQAY
jgi:16S rRNA (cytosine967-C5)-methyltransferase